MEITEILSALISGEKELESIVKWSVQQNQPDDFTLFLNGVTHFYDYIIGHIEHGSNFYTKNDFVEMFEYAVIGYKELPDDIYEWAELYCDGYRYEVVCPETIDHIKDKAINSIIAKVIHDFFIAENDKETAEVRDLIFNYCHVPNCIEIVYPLYQWGKRNTRLDFSFVSAIFEYGYIMGKRAERARRRKAKQS